jgi:hypothetical protein
MIDRNIRRLQLREPNSVDWQSNSDRSAKPQTASRNA